MGKRPKQDYIRIKDHDNQSGLQNQEVVQASGWLLTGLWTEDLGFLNTVTCSMGSSSLLPVTKDKVASCTLNSLLI